MPSFAQPWFLVLFLLVPPLLWHWRRWGRSALRYSDVRLAMGLARGRATWALRGGMFLRGLALVSVVVALADPRWPDAGTRLPTEGIAIAIVVDVSASMGERDFFWQDQLMTRLDGVKRVFQLFVNGGDGPAGEKLSDRSQDLVGLVTFATLPDMACPLTLDHEALLKILASEQPRTIATEATTNPGDAIALAVDALRRAPTRRKIIVFLTDGESNVPPPALTPRQAAQIAGNLEMPIYAIGAGPAFAEDSPEGAEAAAKARKSLADIAKISRGQYFEATDGKALASACSQVDELERSRIVSFQYRRYYEGFTPLAVLAFASWALLLGLETTRWRRIP